MEGETRLSLKVERHPYSYIRLHPDHRAILSTFDNEMVACWLGPRQGRVHVVYDKGIPENTAVITSQLAHELGIRRLAANLHLTLQRRSVRVGNIIGILCSPRWNVSEQTLRAGKQRPILEKLTEAAAAQDAVCFAFAIKDVHLARWKVKGYRYQNGKWSEDEFPLPNVIYDQVISRRSEQHPEHSKIRETLRGLYGNKWFNPGFLDKWEVYEWLREDKRTKPHVPATVRFTSAAEAVKFVNQHSVVFCKPVHGSLGLGILKIERVPEGYIYQIRKRVGPPTQKLVGSAQEAVRALQGRLKSKPYLLQQGISLVRLGERPLDIRIVMQRDGKGLWKRTKMFARVAERGQITSNLSSGGEAVPLLNVFEPIFSLAEKRQRLLQSVRSLSRIVPEVVEQQSGNQFGELGIDMGIDSQGGVWIIEVNSKPWKTTHTDKGRKDLVDLAFERPIQYANYLAGLPH